MSSTEVYTRGRLQLDADEAFDLLDWANHERHRLLVSRSEMTEEGVREGTAFYNERLKRVTKLRKRLGVLIAEKGWGEVPEEEGDA